MFPLRIGRLRLQAFKGCDVCNSPAFAQLPCLSLRIDFDEVSILDLGFSKPFLFNARNVHQDFSGS